MRTVFADSYYFFALANPKDPAHELAKEFTRSFVGTTITTGWILTELADGWAMPNRRSVFLQLLDDLRLNPSVHIIPPTEASLELGVDLYRQRPDKEWSLTDCISFVVMQREGLTEALTGDRHFEQAGFTILLK